MPKPTIYTINSVISHPVYGFVAGLCHESIKKLRYQIKASNASANLSEFQLNKNIHLLTPSQEQTARKKIESKRNETLQIEEKIKNIKITLKLLTDNANI